jgi:NADPH:quinone reductase-like Zn-dependent oxidoreductase
VFSTAQFPADDLRTKITVEGVAIDCRIIETPDPGFDPDTLVNRTRVLVRKSAFSLNYRDRAYVLGTALNAPPNTFAVLGSEFAGEVVACGAEVEGFHRGMRVMANNSYPAEQPGVPGGLPGNNLSRELEIIPAAKLARIPDSMSDVEAAAFAVGAQTVFSMIRKLALAPGSVVLVTGGRSNTSLFAINAVKAQSLDPPPAIYVSTTSDRSERALLEMGVAGVIRIDPTAPSFAGAAAAQRAIEEHGGFDAVIDPFYDVHLVPAVHVMKQGGRYTTCGRYNQTGHLAPLAHKVAPPSPNGLISRILFFNLQIIGNCLGLTSDLETALAAYADGRFSVIVDSVFRDGDAAGFLDRSYNSTQRFGKVVYSYR